jgi:hypothetical protein
MNDRTCRYTSLVCYATETTLGGPARLLWGKALPDVLLCRFGQMASDLVVDLAIQLPGTNEGPQPEQKNPEACHEGPSEIFRKRSTMLAARCHCASSSWSCFRPARVSA